MPAAASMETERTVALLSRYAKARFGSDWRPHDASCHVGPDKGPELGRLLEEGGHVNTDRVVSLINEYGSAKFGDEWFPGGARVWIGHEEGSELEERLGYEAAPLAPAGKSWSVR
jgi:hypothetical protein